MSPDAGTVCLHATLDLADARVPRTSASSEEDHGLSTTSPPPAGPASPPVSQVQILLTERCNLKCRHCAVPAEDSPADHELSTEQWMRFLDVAGAASVESVVVNGGEAMLRKDAIDLIEYGLNAGIRWATLISNGLFFTSRAATHIAEVQSRLPGFGIHISVDGASAQTHDWMRGRGTFDRTMTSVQRLLDAGGRIDGVNSVVHAGNVHEFDELGALAAHWGATIWTVFPNADLGRGVDLGDYRLNRARWIELYDRARAVREATGLFVGIGGPVMADEWPEEDPVIPRPAVRRPDKALIGPDGEVFTCPPLRNVTLGSVSTDAKDAQGWLRIAQRAAGILDQACGSCKYLLVCSNVNLDDTLRSRTGQFGPPHLETEAITRKGAAQ